MFSVCGKESLLQGLEINTLEGERKKGVKRTSLSLNDIKVFLIQKAMKKPWWVKRFIFLNWLIDLLL